MQIFAGKMMADDNEMQLISGESGHKYFTMVLNMAIDDLDAHEMRVLVHYLRWTGHGGSMREGIRETALACRMGKDAVRAARVRLVEKGWLIMEAPNEQERSGGVATRITVVDRWKENILRYTPVPKSDHPPVPDQVHNEEQEEEQRSMPDASRQAARDRYSKIRQQQPSRVAGVPEPRSTKGRLAFTDPGLSHAHRSIARLLKQLSLPVDRGLTEAQHALMTQPVMTIDGKIDSPADESEKFPAEWDEFVRHIPEMAAWKKRVSEQGTKVTVGLIIDMMRGYHWIGGWLEYRPAENTAASSETPTLLI